MNLESTAREIAANFRIGATGAANDAFATWIGEVIQVLEERVSSTDVPALSKLLGLGFEAQQRADYIGLADLLQYEIGPLLGKQEPK
ncbi:MAG: hypothetical protein ACJAZ8_002329 [Planctomycetota bacterium]|jgi:hypothetical protein